LHVRGKPAAEVCRGLHMVAWVTKTSHSFASSKRWLGQGSEGALARAHLQAAPLCTRPHHGEPADPVVQGFRHQSLRKGRHLTAR
jgi:hypothetical protein